MQPDLWFTRKQWCWMCLSSRIPRVSWRSQILVMLHKTYHWFHRIYEPKRLRLWQSQMDQRCKKILSILKKNAIFLFCTFINRLFVSFSPRTRNQSNVDTIGIKLLQMLWLQSTQNYTIMKKVLSKSIRFVWMSALYSRNKITLNLRWTSNSVA